MQAYEQQVYSAIDAMIIENNGWVNIEKGAEMIHDIHSQQASIPYSDLSEEDKEKYRKQFRKFFIDNPK